MAGRTGQAGTDEWTHWGAHSILPESYMSTKILWYTINIRVCREAPVARRSLYDSSAPKVEVAWKS
jgi:hypothetical protein